MIDQHGVRPSKEKVKAIREVLCPKNESELCAYLGIINFYAKFVLNMSTELKQLYDLLQKGTKWHWSRAEDNAFNRSKTWLAQENVSTFYRPKKELELVCDASAFGAVLFHRVWNDEKPTAYAS